MKKKQSVVHNKFNRFIEDNSIFKDNCSILAAISGGQDSICLLKLLKDYQKNKKVNIHVIHFNHGWRKDADSNADFIRKVAYRWSLNLHYQKAHTILSEEKARIWRYSTMQKICLELNIKYIATGHTYNDRLETILFNMVKGAGFEGTQAIQPIVEISNKITLAHPLIHLKREETLWFCRKFSLPIWSDITNYNRQLSRNRIREELIPYCKQYFNLKVEDSLHKFTENINYDLDYLQQRTYYLYYKYKHPKYIGINRQTLSLLPLSIKRRIIRAFVYHNTNIKLNFSETKQYVSLVKSHHIQFKQISPSWYLCISNKWIYLLYKDTKIQ